MDANTAEPQVRVTMLATVGPTPTDKNSYPAGTEWTMPKSRADELERDELAIITDELPAPVPAAPAAPSEE
jgi:hypothetical protein